jgi:hypothetical protein
MMKIEQLEADHFYFASESVTEGHPDKLCDSISDSVLDACLKQDPLSWVACETATKSNMVFFFFNKLGFTCRRNHHQRCNRFRTNCQR